MRILRVIEGTNLTEGGPIEGVRQMSAALASRGHVTEVASLDVEGAPWLDHSPFKVHALGTRRDHYLDAPRLRSWLISNARDYDVVIQHGLWNPTSFTTWRAMRKTNSPYLVYAHGMLDPWFRKERPLKYGLKQLIWWVVDGRLAAEAKYVLFTSEEELLLARKGFWPRHYSGRVVKYGTGDVDIPSLRSRTDAFRQLVPNLGSRPYLLFLGRIHPKKGCDILIESFAATAAQSPDLQLVIAGPDEAHLQQDLIDLANGLGVGSRIHWPGMLVDEAKWGAFVDAEAFVLPSHQENFGIAVAEAMACGRPVLISNKVNIWREVLSCGGGLVSEDNVAGVTRILRSFFEMSAEDRSKMGRNARAGFLSNFEITHAAEALLPILAEIARKEGRSREVL